MQRLADSNDKLKRERGRRGLEVVRRLQRSAVDVSVEDFGPPGAAMQTMLVDARLVGLAASLPAKIITTDTGLAKVAEIRGVATINLNVLANAMKPSLIPGEKLTIELVKRGEQPGQGVGYLPDGTMVVAEDGETSVGTAVELTVATSIQTANGRMIFGRIGAEPDARPPLRAEAPPQPESGANSGESGQAGAGELSSSDHDTPDTKPDVAPSTERTDPQRPDKPGKRNRQRNPRR